MTVMSTVWSVGDVVQVLGNDGYWRGGMINEVMEDDYYFVRVFESVHHSIVEKSSVRARQEGKDNDRFLVDKEFENRESLMNTKVQKVADQSVVLSKSLKRSSPDYASADLKCVRKRRLVDKEVDLDAIHGDAYSFTGKVDKVQITTEKTISDMGKAKSRNHELDDYVSTISSVASCSNTNAIPDKLVSHSSAGCSQDHSVSLSSDAESYSHDLGEEEEVSSAQLQRGDALEAHELDLYGYRCVLESLYSSGPLSWEQEISLTNLRLKYSVSNDEHLTELRRLKSSRNLGLCY